MKKIVSILVILILILGMNVLPAKAEEYTEVGGIIYIINIDKEMASVRGYEGEEEEVVIPSRITYKGDQYPVMSIESTAFSNCDKLKQVTIPGSVWEIGNKAFVGCVSLESVIFEEGVGHIGNSIFEDCSNLTTLTIPQSAEFEPNCFVGATQLKTIYFSGTQDEWETLKPEILFSNYAAIKVYYSEVSINCTVYPEGAGSVTGAGDILIGEIVTLIPTAIDGYTFDKWTEGENTIEVDSEVLRDKYSFKAQQDRTLVAHFKKGYKISVSANTQEGTVEGAGIYDPDKTTEVKVKAVPNEGYEFVNWTENGTVVSDKATYEFILQGDRNLVANFRKKTYTITFVNEDGTVLQSIEVEYDKKPTYTANTPTKEPDAQYTYTFAGWDKELTEVTGEATYIATYEKTVNRYKITFVDEDGRVLQSIRVEYGKTPEYEGEDPTKEADVQYSYTFAGWDKEPTAVTGEATYTATYEKTVNKYLITFVNEDGTVLQSIEVEYGKTPEYEGDDPTKEADAQYSYSFAGWDKEIVEVTGDATYTATYNQSVNKYVITFVDEDGTELQSSEVEYGKMPEYTGEEPTKDADEQYTYTFDGWDPELTEVTGTATYTAKYLAEEIIVEPEPEPEPVEIIYTVSEGGDGEWTQGSGTDYTIVVNRSEDDENCFSHYAETLIDGKKAEVKAESGSTVITISADTLNKLSVGEHKITVKFDDGEVETKISIKEAAETGEPDDGKPRTGDTAKTTMWVILLSISVAGLATAWIYNKKRAPKEQ